MAARSDDEQIRPARHGRPTASIAVCHDGSAHAQAATEALSRLPWAASTAVTVVSVDDGTTHADEALATAAAALRQTGAVVRCARLEGKPADEMLRHLWEHQADLVVAGSRGRSATQRPRLGSTAAALARGLPSSLLIAAGGG